MFKEITGRVKESASSLGPFFALILLIHFSGFFMVGSVDMGILQNVDIHSVFEPGFYETYYAVYAFTPVLVCFLLAFPLMVLGMALYGMGADQAMTKMGMAVGSSLTKKKQIGLLFVASFLLGTLCTFAEPDLTVFSTQLMGEGGKYVLISIISIGVGLLLALALVRILFQWDYKILMYVIFLVTFGLGMLVNRETFFPVVFDGSGVTIGSITVPFVLAMGIAVAQIRGSANAEDDSFGITGLASLGPLITVFVWAKIMDMIGVNDQFFAGILGNAANANATGPATFGVLGSFYASATVSSLTDTAVAMAPLVVFFFAYDLLFIRLNKTETLKIVVGLVEAFVGLSVFMIGINSGFIPVARQLGMAFASSGFQSHFYAVMIACGLIGFLIILGEPAVHVLSKSVEEVSRGSISVKELYVALCCGVAGALILGIAKVQFQWEMKYIVIPLLVIFFLLALFVPKLFTGLALDSAGIASSTMASAFLLPMEIGMAMVKFGPSNTEQVVRYGTGMVGLVYICPLIAIELLGLYGKAKNHVLYEINRNRVMEPDDSQIIHLGNAMASQEGGSR